MYKSILTLILLAVVLFLPAERGKTFANSPRLFDQFGNIREGDLAARLDNYAIQLQYEPESTGYIVVFAPESASKRIHKNITDYIVISWRMPRERLKTYHAGYNDPLTEPLTQLYILPKGAEAPKPAKREVDLAAFKGKLAEDNGPTFSIVVSAACDEILKAQKDSIAHVVVFIGAEDRPKAWRRVANTPVGYLKRFGFPSNRFRTAYGGRSKETKMQLWILPRGEMPPLSGVNQ